MTYFIDAIKDLVNYTCLNENIVGYFSGEMDTDIVIEKANFLFNYDYLMYPTGRHKHIEDIEHKKT